MSDFEFKVKEILGHYSNYVYYEGDPMRDPDNLDDKEAVKSISSLVREKVELVIGEEELHTHNSIPSYTASLDEGCITCEENHKKEMQSKRAEEIFGK